MKELSIRTREAIKFTFRPKTEDEEAAEETRFNKRIIQLQSQLDGTLDRHGVRSDSDVIQTPYIKMTADGEKYAMSLMKKGDKEDDCYRILIRKYNGNLVLGGLSFWTEDRTLHETTSSFNIDLLETEYELRKQEEWGEDPRTTKSIMDITDMSSVAEYIENKLSNTA